MTAHPTALRLKPPRSRRLWLLIVLLLAVLLLLLLPSLVTLAAEWPWFQALGYQSVFVTRLVAVKRITVNSGRDVTNLMWQFRSSFSGQTEAFSGFEAGTDARQVTVSVQVARNARPLVRRSGSGELGSSPGGAILSGYFGDSVGCPEGGEN